jgi:hypothetical protein
MPRYIFRVRDDTFDPHDLGVEISDLETAKCEAVKFAGTLVCEAGATFWDKGDWEMTVTDEHGLSLFTLVFAGFEAAAIA